MGFIKGKKKTLEGSLYEVRLLRDILLEHWALHTHLRSMGLLNFSLPTHWGSAVETPVHPSLVGLHLNLSVSKTK